MIMILLMKLVGFWGRGQRVRALGRVLWKVGAMSLELGLMRFLVTLIVFLFRDVCFVKTLNFVIVKVKERDLKP